MARQSVKLRNKKREALVARSAEKRAELKKLIINPEISYEERMLARDTLNKLPRDGSSVRVVNRCAITGRPHGVYRKFKMCRNQFRDLASAGKLPGVTKSSW